MTNIFTNLVEKKDKVLDVKFNNILKENEDLFELEMNNIEKDIEYTKEDNVLYCNNEKVDHTPYFKENLKSFNKINKDTLDDDETYNSNINKFKFNSKDKQNIFKNKNKQETIEFKPQTEIIQKNKDFVYANENYNKNNIKKGLDSDRTTEKQILSRNNEKEDKKSMNTKRNKENVKKEIREKKGKIKIENNIRKKIKSKITINKVSKNEKNKTFECDNEDIRNEKEKNIIENLVISDKIKIFNQNFIKNDLNIEYDCEEKEKNSDEIEEETKIYNENSFKNDQNKKLDSKEKEKNSVEVEEMADKTNIYDEILAKNDLNKKLDSKEIEISQGKEDLLHKMRISEDKTEDIVKNIDEIGDYSKNSELNKNKIGEEKLKDNLKIKDFKCNKSDLNIKTCENTKNDSYKPFECDKKQKTENKFSNDVVTDEFSDKSEKYNQNEIKINTKTLKNRIEERNGFKTDYKNPINGDKIISEKDFNHTKDTNSQIYDSKFSSNNTKKQEKSENKTNTNLYYFNNIIEEENKKKPDELYQNIAYNAFASFNHDNIDFLPDNSDNTFLFLDPRLFQTSPKPRKKLYVDPKVFFTDDPLNEQSYIKSDNYINIHTNPNTNLTTSSNKILNNNRDINTKITTNLNTKGYTKITDNINYQKPPYSYAQLISQALHSLKDKKMQLKEIYDYISSKYPFYKRGDPTWHNSIRHNLSMNKAFMKVSKNDKENGKKAIGKGGFWTIDNEYMEREKLDSNLLPIKTCNYHRERDLDFSMGYNTNSGVNYNSGQNDNEGMSFRGRSFSQARFDFFYGKFGELRKYGFGRRSESDNCKMYRSDASNDDRVINNKDNININTVSKREQFINSKGLSEKGIKIFFGELSSEKKRDVNNENDKIEINNISVINSIEMKEITEKYNSRDNTNQDKDNCIVYENDNIEKSLSQNCKKTDLVNKNIEDNGNINYSYFSDKKNISEIKEHILRHQRKNYKKEEKNVDGKRKIGDLDINYDFNVKKDNTDDCSNNSEIVGRKCRRLTISSPTCNFKRI